MEKCILYTQKALHIAQICHRVVKNVNIYNLDNDSCRDVGSNARN